MQKKMEPTGFLMEARYEQWQVMQRFYQSINQSILIYIAPFKLIQCK